MRPRNGDPTWPAREDLVLLGTDIRRVDGPDKVSGRARYTHDVRLPNMVYARLLLAPVPAATVRVDVAPALALDGVAAALDLSEGAASYLGQPIAVVAAETPERADDGVRAVVVEIEEEPWAITHEQSLAEGAPQIGSTGNVRSQTSGDEEAAEAALAECDAVVDETYSVPVQHHACLETHGVVVDYSGGATATIYASTQGTGTIAGPAAKALGLQQSDVRAEVEHMGGGFGGKFGLGLEGQVACRLARQLSRPVHLMLTRAQEFLLAGNRSGARQHFRAGARSDGTLHALVARVDKEGGTGRGSYAGQPYIYTVESAYADIRSVLTQMDSSRAFRAPGHPQASFGIESVIDELAYAVGVDPLEMRKKNLTGPAAPVYHRQLDRVAEEIGWPAHPHRTAFCPTGEVREGIGFGVSTWGGGGRAVCEVTLRIGRDGSVRAQVGSQDLGTGTRTMIAAIVAEEFGLEVGAVTAAIGHSDYGPANPSGGSTTAASLAPAVKDAAHKGRLALLEIVAGVLGSDPAALVIERGEGESFIHDPSDPSSIRVTWRQACASGPPEGIVVHGVWREHLASRGVQGAQAARVSIDTLTGEVRVLRMVCYQNCGLPLNRLALRSQINGGMIQSLSYALFEERILDPDLGVMLNANLSAYKIAGCQDIPELVALIDDEDDRGVIGIGEPPAIPGQSAIANAIYNACGVRLRHLPLTADKVLEGLVENGQWGGAL